MRHSVSSRSYATLLAMAALFVSGVALAVPSIVAGPAMLLEGTHEFTMDETVPAGAVTWTLDREVRSESGSGGSWTRTNNVDGGSGQSMSFLLSKVAGKETVYYIRATGGGFDETRKVQVFPPDVRSSFHFESNGNPNVRTYIIVPSTLSPATHMIVVMHGSGRNSNEYCDTWVTWASQNDYIAICPTFNDSNWPRSAGYNLGNVFSGSNCSGSLEPEQQWAFSVVENLQQTVRDKFAIIDEQFDMWGHSAGGQFTHRFMLFKPDAKVRLGIPANPGWYTAPDTAVDCPYGVKHPQLDFTQQNLVDWSNKEMIIMRGVLDTQRTGSLRQTPEADAQGQNRYARAGYMYDKGVEVNPATRWQLIDVPGVGHEQRDMAPAAQNFLIQNPPGNQAPSVNAGADMITQSDLTPKLEGVVNDDGRPNPPAMVITWSQISGPSGLTFIKANTVDTRVAFTQVGSYVLQLSANDGEFESTDTVTLTVGAPLPNQAPVVNAGSDIDNAISNIPVSLTGTLTDDGRPVSATLARLWTMQRGPGTVIFSDQNSATSTAIFSAEGSYVLQLSADDSELTGSDEVTITVNPPPALILSEVLYNATGPDGALEWVELFNTSANTIDLSGYSLGNGGTDFSNSTVQLSGTIGAGQTFVIGGATSNNNNTNPTFDQVIDFSPDFQNVNGGAADGVALFDVLASQITSVTVPVDAVVYGAINSSNLIDETGTANAPEVVDSGEGKSIERIDLVGSWVVQPGPTPGSVASGISVPTNQAPTFNADPISKAVATEDVAYLGNSLSNDASDPDGDTLSFFKLSGALWLSVATDGSLSGTPGDRDIGVNTIIVQVMDPDGLTHSATLTINVQAVAKTNSSGGGAFRALDMLFLLIIVFIVWINNRQQKLSFTL